MLVLYIFSLYIWGDGWFHTNRVYPYFHKCFQVWIEGKPKYSSNGRRNESGGIGGGVIGQISYLLSQWLEVCGGEVVKRSIYVESIEYSVKIAEQLTICQSYPIAVSHILGQIQ